MSIEDPFKGIALGKQHVYYTLELMLVAEINGANPGKPWEPVLICSYPMEKTPTPAE